MRSLGRSAQLTLVYYLVDDGLKSEKNGSNRRKSNHHPKCTDAEIIAVAMMQSYFGTATLKRTYLLIKANDAKAFPLNLCQPIRRGRVNLLPTGYDDRAGARMLASVMTEGSLCLADVGYREAQFQLEMYEEEGVLFLTRADITSQRLKILHSTIRTRVEGIFSSLWERFATRGCSRSWHGLWNTLKLKMLDYKLCFAKVISYA